MTAAADPVDPAITGFAPHGPASSAAPLASRPRKGATPEGAADLRVQRQAMTVLKLGELFPSPHNRRVFKQDAAFAELVASVKAVGLLQAAVARDNPTDVNKPRYELLAGHRRWRACLAAGLPTIEVKVVECDERTAAAICAAENLQRADLTPLEEAATIEDLFAAGYDAATAAAEFGRTPQWISRRARLAHLIEPLRRMLADPTSALGDSPLAVSERLASLPPEQQEVARDAVVRFGPFNTLRHFDQVVLREQLRSLAAARWKLDDESLDSKAGSCAACPKRSAAQPLLFDDIAGGGKQGFCLDSRCWDRKTAAFLKRCADKLKAEHGDVVALHSDNGMRPLPGIAKAIGLPVLREYNARPAQPGQRGAVPALTVNGPDTGKVTWVKSPDPRAQNRQQPDAAEKPGKPKALSLKDRRASWVCMWVSKKCGQDGVLLEGGRPILTPIPDAFTLLRLGLEFGLTDTPARGKKLEAIESADELGIRRMAFREILVTWENELDLPEEQLKDSWWHSQLPGAIKLVERFSKIGGWDLADLWKQASQAIPDDKGVTTAALDRVDKQPAQKRGKKAGPKPRRKS